MQNIAGGKNMYIDPFVGGVLSTIGVELLLLFISAVVNTFGKK